MNTELGTPIIDTMIGFPTTGFGQYDFIKQQAKDTQTRSEFEFPVEYMFKDVPKDLPTDDPIAVTLHEMDRFGITQGVVNVIDETGREALRRHPDHFIASFDIDANQGTEAILELARNHRDFGVRAAAAFPAGMAPQVPINDKKMYPIYAKCVELDIPIFVNAGVPGPRLAEPVLLHLRVLPRVLPEGRRRLRQHPWRRQDHLRGLLPDGAEPGTNPGRIAQSAVPRSRVAEVPARQRPPDPQAHLNLPDLETRPAARMAVKSKQSVRSSWWFCPSRVP